MNLAGFIILFLLLFLFSLSQAVVLHVKNKHTRNPSDTSHQSLRSDVEAKYGDDDNNDDDDNEDDEIMTDEKTPLVVSNGIVVSINSKIIQS